MAGNGKPYEFAPPSTARGDSRVTTQGEPPSTRQFKGSIRVANIIAPGDPLNIPTQGSQFYFRVCTGTLLVKESGGVYAPYGQGEGLNVSLDNAFDLLQLKNPNSFPVVFELFIGFSSFIDNKLILSSTVTPNVSYPTYPKASAAVKVNIPDLSGNAFKDINGKSWYAISRVAIFVSNIDSGVTLLLQEAETVIANDDAVLAIFPLTSIQYPVSGDYALSVGGGNVNAIVSEIYQALAP
jgi:hypothetical protein